MGRLLLDTGRWQLQGPTTMSISYGTPIAEQPQAGHPIALPKSTQSSQKCQAMAAGGVFPSASSHRTWFNTSRHVPRGISLQGWQPSVGAANCMQGVIKHSPNYPRGSPVAVGAPLQADGAPAHPRQVEISPTHQPQKEKAEPGFYPRAQSPFPSACPAGVYGGITVEQLLIHRGQPQHCLMATPVMARMSRGRGVPSGVGPSKALSFLLLVAPSWDLGCSRPSRAGEEPLGRPFRTMNFSGVRLAANIFPSGFVQSGSTPSFPPPPPGGGVGMEEADPQWE